MKTTLKLISLVGIFTTGCDNSNEPMKAPIDSVKTVTPKIDSVIVIKKDTIKVDTSKATLIKKNG